MRIGVIGSRNFTNYAFTEGILKEYLHDCIIVTGDAKGVDAMARKYAKNRSIPLEVHYADWNKYGRAAGPIRNKELVKNLDLLLAFPEMRMDGLALDEHGDFTLFRELLDEGIYCSPGSRSAILQANNVGCKVLFWSV